MRMIFPDGVFAREQVVDHGLAQQRYFVGGLDIFGGEGLAFFDADVANGQIFGRHAVDLGPPVIASVDHLLVVILDRRRVLHGGAFGLNRLGIPFRERLRVAVAALDSAGVLAARLNHDDVAADGGDLLMDAVGGAAAHRYHGDHGADADDDAEHGQRRAQLVHAQRAERDSHALEDFVHATGSFSSSSSGISASSRSAFRGLGTASSSMR